MRKGIIVLIAMLVLVLLFLSMDHKLDSAENTAESTIKQARQSAPATARVPVGPHQSALSPSQATLDSMNPLDPDELLTGPGGYVYKSVHDITGDPVLVEQLREDLENFQKYGSIGKGKPTIEFEAVKDRAASLERKGLEALLQGLAFNPIQLSKILGPDFSLIGADDQGKFISSKGWNSFIQIAESGTTGKQVELSEFQIESQLGDTTEVIEEFLNGNVADVRAMIQTMKDPAGKMVVSVQWNEGERSFTLNTKSFTLKESTDLAEEVLKQYRSLPHNGWKQPYVLDPENPLHRIAIQKNRQKTDGTR